MLYSLGRETDSAAQWAKIAGPLVQEARVLPVEGLAGFMGIWSKSVSYLGESELYARKADRYEVFEYDQAVGESARRRFEKFNDRGIEGLEQARARLQKVGHEFEEWDRQLEGRDLAGELQEYRELLFADLADVEMKVSDARKLRALVDEAVETTQGSGLSGLARWMDAQLERGIEARRQPDRGAEENFAKWKLAAVIALLLALGIAFWIHCGWFSCSAYSRTSYISAILTTAGLWWC